MSILTLDINRQKINLLYSFSELLPQEPFSYFTIGLLVGLIDRVHFVKNLTGAPIGIRITSNAARLWPHPSISAFVNNISIPDPMTLGSYLVNSSDPICVELIHPYLFRDETIQHLFFDEFADIKDGPSEEKHYKVQRTEKLREQINHALDVYNECQAQLEQSHSEQHKEQLQSFMRIAKQSLTECSRELKQLEEQLN